MNDVSTAISLIQTKLHRPPIYGVHLLRQRLLDQLDQRHKRPLTLISAPAGYGKTMVASSWLEASDSPSAWLSLDETDNDLRVFLVYFVSAIRTLFPHFGRQTLEMVNASTLAPVSTLAGSLINEIDGVEKSFVLALDDFHLIKDKSLLDLISQLLHHPPQSFHLVLISRRDPYLPISTLRASRLMTEIRTQDLRFCEVEVTQLLTKMLGTQVDLPTTAALEKKTEGWVTGLHLATLSGRHRGDLDPRLLAPQVNTQSHLIPLSPHFLLIPPPQVYRALVPSAWDDGGS